MRNDDRYDFNYKDVQLKMPSSEKYDGCMDCLKERCVNCSTPILFWEQSLSTRIGLTRIDIPIHADDMTIADDRNFKNRCKRKTKCKHQGAKEAKSG